MSSPVFAELASGEICVAPGCSRGGRRWGLVGLALRPSLLALGRRVGAKIPRWSRYGASAWPRPVRDILLGAVGAYWRDGWPWRSTSTSTLRISVLTQWP